MKTHTNTDRWLLLSAVALTIALAQACKDMYGNIEPYAKEVVYPGRYDTIVAHIGFERVELDLMKAGRVPADKIAMGKAKKTIVEYDRERLVLDGLHSWVNVTGLSTAKLYRIRVYTEDEHGNRSVPQEIAVIPYAVESMASLAVPAPRLLASPSAAVADWPSGLSSIVLEYDSLTFEYVDKNGAAVSGKRGAAPRIAFANLPVGQAVEVKFTYYVRPKVGGKPILDGVPFIQEMTLNMPAGSTPFVPAEKSILEANGVATFTADGVATFTKLTFPMDVATLQDIFYFPNLTEVDLTGGPAGMFRIPEKTYQYGTTAITGETDYPPFVRLAKPIMAEPDIQVLLDLLDAGAITKVKYIPNSMGIDHFLQPYDAQGKIEWIPAASLPNESFIPLEFFANGNFLWPEYGVAAAVPSTDTPSGSGIVNPFKITLTHPNANFMLMLPPAFQFDMDTYKKLKFRVYMPAKSQFVGAYEAYQKLWPRFINHPWVFPGDSAFGLEDWGQGTYSVPDSELENWHEVTLDLSPGADKHSRVILMNIGGEPSVDPFAPANDMVYYFSNFRFSK